MIGALPKGLKAHALAVGAADLSQFLAWAVEHDRRLLVRITFELLRTAVVSRIFGTFDQATASVCMSCG